MNYSPEYKEAILRRMLPPNNESITKIAKEEGLFDLEDVARTISDKMVRRHPHVFGSVEKDITTGEVLVNWEEIKKQEKAGREWEADYLAGAMDEASELLEVAKKRKGFI